MITISKKVEYSVALISYLAKNNKDTVSLMEASKKLLLPYRFMGQLALALRSSGIVDSREGKSGGYRLSPGWEKKSVYDLLEALGENRHMVECLGDKKCARESKCSVRKVWNEIEKNMVVGLRKVKLAEI